MKEVKVRRHIELSANDFTWAVVIAVLGLAGGFKNTPLLAWLPVDVTLLSALAVMLGTMSALTGHGATIPAQAGKLLLLWACFAPSLIIAYARNISMEKGVFLFTLTLLTALAPFYLLGTRERVQLWLWLQVVGAVVVAIGMRVYPSEYDALRGQVSLQGASSISVGRTIGAATVIVIITILVKGWRAIWLAPLGFGLFASLLMVGNRGSLVSVLLAITLTSVLGGQRRQARLVLASITAFAALHFSTRFSVIDPADRIGVLMRPLSAGREDGAIGTRQELWTAAVNIGLNRPWGDGWGAFSLAPEMRYVGSDAYAHSILPELLAEGGLLAALAFTTYAAASLRRLVGVLDDRLATLVFAVAVFWLTAAFFSEDVNGNRMMWIALALCWVVPAIVSRDRSEALIHDFGRNNG